MLSGYDAQVIAFFDGTEILCHDCAVHDTSTVTVEKAERGLSNAYGLQPLSRYTLETDFYGEGLLCGGCDTWLVEPTDDFDDDEED